MAYRLPSYRGVRFNEQDDSLRSGRRGHLYQYPNRNQAAFVDLGQKAPVIEISGYYVGDDSLAEWHKLETALNNPEPGELITYRGRRIKRAHCTEYNSKHGVKKGRNITYFTLKFVEASVPVYPEAKTNVRGQLQTAITSSKTVAKDRLANDIFADTDSGSIPSWAKDALSGDFGRYISEYANKNNGRSAHIINQFNFLNSLERGAEGVGIKDVINRLQSLSRISQQRIAPLPDNSDIARSVNDNSDIVYESGHSLTLASSAEVLLEDLPESRQEADNIRRAFHAAADDIKRKSESEAVYDSLTNLDVAVSKFISEESLRLPEERPYKAEQELPALVIANRLKGDNKDDIVPTQEEIIVRNDIKDPVKTGDVTWIA